MTFQLVEVTGEIGEIEKGRKNEFEGWAGGLTLPAYQEKDVVLDKGLTSRQRQIRYWVYRDEAGNVASSCRCMVRPITMVSKNSGARPATDAVIANVFTAAAARGQGHAAKMIQQVTAILTKEHEMVSLWSDVGDYYARFGFRFIGGNESLIVPPQNGGVGWPAGVEQITEPHLDSFVPKLSAALQHKSAQLSQQGAGADVYFVDARPEYFQWLVDRSQFARRAKGQPESTVFGATKGDAWLIWIPYMDDKHYEVVAGSGPASDLAVLFQAAASQAAGEKYIISCFADGIFGATGAEIAAQAAQLGLKIEHEPRKNHLPMVVGPSQWVGAGLYAWF